MIKSVIKMKTEPCKQSDEEKVAFVNVIEESAATEKVEKVYEDIKKTLGIDFIPNMYKAMANSPEYLEASWHKIQATMSSDGKIDNKTKDIVAFIVSVMTGSEYCIGVYTDALRHNGLDDEALTELYAVVDTYAGLNRLNIAWGVKADEKPWHGCGGNR